MTGASSAVRQDFGYVSGVCQVSAREYESDSLTTQPLDAAWWLPFQDYSPARALPSFKGQRNFTGLLWCATNARLVGYESWLERDHLLALDFDPAVVGIASQPFRLDFDSGHRWHIPDYFARLRDGTGVVIDVRPDERIGERDRELFTATEFRIPARPLPRPVRPYKDETTPSFIRRLETANTLRPGQLRTLLKGSRRPWIESLAAWTDYDPAVLVLAMPQLGQHDPDPSVRRKLAGRPTRTTHTVACHRCTLARGAGRYVELYSTHEQVICPRHGLWIGDDVNGFTDQFSIRAGPEITAAWHHHKNLITRHGRPGVRKAFHISGVINRRWYDQFQHFTAATETYDALAADQPGHANSHAVVAASLYPSIVTLTAAMASPHWAKIAHSRRPNLFLDRISVEVTEGWSPRGAFDPLRHWMDTDWSPGFRGSDVLRPSPPR